ncbi:MAG: ferritin-like domain-containing protein [Planctomycetota bacterium]|jgi:rubrerythrin
MDVRFTGPQILEIAEQIECNASQFYRKAAEMFEEPRLRDLFEELDAWETTHQKLFAEMRKQFVEEFEELGAFDPDIYMSSNPRLMASLAVFAVDSDAKKQFTGREKPEEVLRKAVKNEKNTITFYQGLKDFAQSLAGADVIDRIIQEEQTHIRILTQSLEQR